MFSFQHHSDRITCHITQLCDSLWIRYHTSHRPIAQPLQVQLLQTPRQIIAMLEEVILFRQPSDSCKLFVTGIPLRESWDELRIRIIASCKNELLVHSVRLHRESKTEYIPSIEPEPEPEPESIQPDAALSNASAQGDRDDQKMQADNINDSIDLISLTAPNAQLTQSSISTSTRYETREFKWAIIQYYCRDDALTAKRRLHLLRTTAPSKRSQSNRHDNSNCLRVNMFRRSRPASINPLHLPLAFHECVNVCNYFLGFNAWSCEVDEIRPYSVEAGDEKLEEDDAFAQQMSAAPSRQGRDEDTASQASTDESDSEAAVHPVPTMSSQSNSRSLPMPTSAYANQARQARAAAKARSYQGSYTAQVSLHLRHMGGTKLTAKSCAHSDSLMSGIRFVGSSRSDASSNALSSCKKRAVTNAYRLLFHRLAIVRLASGKCCVSQI